MRILSMHVARDSVDTVWRHLPRRRLRPRRRPLLPEDSPVRYATHRRNVPDLLMQYTTVRTILSLSRSPGGRAAALGLHLAGARIYSIHMQLNGRETKHMLEPHTFRLQARVPCKQCSWSVDDARTMQRALRREYRGTRSRLKF